MYYQAPWLSMTVSSCGCVHEGAHVSLVSNTVEGCGCSGICLLEGSKLQEMKGCMMSHNQTWALQVESSVLPNSFDLILKSNTFQHNRLGPFSDGKASP
eukprot:m.101489 g.101489  ORF g.101489 m.101489 type:complete len:99 (+) comp13200_c0_seq1:172-468(+)